MIYVKEICVSIIALTLFYSCEVEVHRCYYSNGTLKEEYSMKNDEFMGGFRALYPDGKLQAKGKYTHGKMDGLWQHFYSSGNRKSIEEYSKGKLINFNYWDEEGTQKIIDGTGVVKQYYPSGLLQSVLSYRDNVFHGKSETWYSDGIKEMEYYYENGKPTGTWTYWDEFGRVIKIKEYD